MPWPRRSEAARPGTSGGTEARLLADVQRRRVAADVPVAERMGREAELTPWTDRILDARTLADVFAD